MGGCKVAQGVRPNRRANNTSGGAHGFQPRDKRCEKNKYIIV